MSFRFQDHHFLLLLIYCPSSGLILLNHQPTLTFRLSCFTDHRSVINKIYDNLRPGGWFESQDFSFDLVAADAATEAVLAGSSIRLWQQRMFEGMRTLGRDLRVARHYAQW